MLPADANCFVVATSDATSGAGEPCSHVVVAGAQHELLMEQDAYRNQFWAAFDAFVHGTPLFSKIAAD